MFPRSRLSQIVILLTGLLISGCASVQQAVLDANTSNAASVPLREPKVITADTAPAAASERSPQSTAQIGARPETPPRQTGCDRANAVSVGMTVAQVYASCWGKPKSVNASVMGATKTEMLLYEGYNYLYVENGIVKSIETSSR